MVRHQFEVSQSPIEGCRGNEVVVGGVFVAELAGIVWANADWVAESQEQGSGPLPKVVVVAQDQVGEGVVLETDMFAVRQKIDPLQNVETVP